MPVTEIRFCSRVVLYLLLAALAPGTSPASAQTPNATCDDFQNFGYVCGPLNAEDLVLVPDTHWIIASAFGGSESLYLIDAQQKTWRNLYPADAPRARQNMTTFGSCPGTPDPNSFFAHGLSIRKDSDGAITLYVVGHGDREAVEVFDVDTSGREPVVTWTGCVRTPDSLQANSVASMADGSLLVTIPLHEGHDISEIFSGEASGAIYAWSPGDPGFTRVEGTDMPYANGIEVSADGKEFYVASSGLRKVLAFSNSNPARLLRSTETLDFVPDNIHRSGDGQLLTAGMDVMDAECGNVDVTAPFDIAKVAACARPFTVLALDAPSLQQTVLLHSPRHESFSNVTMALPVGGELWIGTFAGSRVAYVKAVRANP